MSESAEKLLSFHELEDRTGIKVQTWRAWAAQRRFPVVHLGRRIKMRESDLQKFVAANTTPALPERDAR
jgi:predicted DNA-binding transcriptional regulator AlpA